MRIGQPTRPITPGILSVRSHRITGVLSARDVDAGASRLARQRRDGIRQLRFECGRWTPHLAGMPGTRRRAWTGDSPRGGERTTSRAIGRGLSLRKGATRQAPAMHGITRLKPRHLSKRERPQTSADRYSLRCPRIAAIPHRTGYHRSCDGNRGHPQGAGRRTAAGRWTTTGPGSRLIPAGSPA